MGVQRREAKTSVRCNALLYGSSYSCAPSVLEIGTLMLIASPLTLALIVLFFATFSPTAEGAMTGIAGLTERILIVESLTPVVLLGWLAWGRSPRRP
jgi:hypothetical protein